MPATGYTSLHNFMKSQVDLRLVAILHIHFTLHWHKDLLLQHYHIFFNKHLSLRLCYTQHLQRLCYLAIQPFISSSQTNLAQTDLFTQVYRSSASIP